MPELPASLNTVTERLKPLTATVRGGEVILIALVALSLLTILKTNRTLALVRQENRLLSTSLTIMQQRVTGIQEKQKYYFEHTNAEFDATKNQVRATTLSVLGLHSKVNDFTKPAPIKDKPKKIVKNAKRP